MAETIILTTTLLILFFCLRYLADGKISARLQYALWIFVAARLLSAWLPMPASGISILHLYEISQERIAGNIEDKATKQAEKTAGQTKKNQTENGNGLSGSQDQRNNLEEDKPAFFQKGQESNFNQPADSSALLSGRTTDTKTTEDVLPLKPGQLIRLIYITGVCLVLFLILLYNIRFYWFVRKRRILYEGELPYQQIPGRVYLLENTVSPFLFGRHIYLAPEVTANPKMLYHILVHETCHWKQGDMFWAVIKNICLALYWYHPLVWIALRLAENDAELSCDERALSVLGGSSPLEYGQTLLSLLKGQKKNQTALCLSTQMSGKKHTVEKRVKRIAKKAAAPQKKAAVIGTSVMTVIGILLCALVTFPEPAQKAESDIAADVSMESDWSVTEKEGYPAVVIDEAGNITGTIRGNLFTRMVLDYTAVKDGDNTNFSPFQIKSKAFSDCKNLKTLIIPEQLSALSYVKYIAADAFEGCPEDLVVYCEKESYVYQRLNEIGIQTKPCTTQDNWYLLGEDAKKRQALYKEAGEVPASALSGKTFRALYGEPFFIMTQSGVLMQSQCDSLTEIYTKEIRFPREASVINGTFCQYAGLTDITITKNITEIGASSFLHCQVKKVVFEPGSKLKRIGDGAFMNEAFPEIRLPEGLEEIGSSAFYWCENLKKITLPESVQTVGDRCFTLCGSLKKITIQNPNIKLEGTDIFDQKLYDSASKKMIPNRQLTICCHRGSTAEKYAKKHGFRVTYLKEKTLKNE